MGKHFTQKPSELLFRPEGDFAIIHVVVFSFRSFTASCILQENEVRRPRFFPDGEERSSTAKRFQTGEAVARAMPIGVKIGGLDGVRVDRKSKMGKLQICNGVKISRKVGII